MTSEAICELLKPLIGRSGSVFLAGKGFGQIALAMTDNKLSAVEVLPDGMVRLERETGWTVLDPAAVVAVAWNGDAGHSAGQFL